jgi:hypothetical protein
MHERLGNAVHRPVGSDSERTDRDPGTVTGTAAGVGQ